MYANARQYLRQYLQIKREIAIKRRSRAMLIEVSQLSGVDFTKSRVQSTPKGDQIGDIVVRLEAMDKEINSGIMRMLDVLEEIEQTINRIESPIVREVLQRRYIFGERWEAIAEHMVYSQSQIFRVHRIGLVNIERLIDGNNKRDAAGAN